MSAAAGQGPPATLVERALGVQSNGGLTVALALAEGRTTREAAAKLYLSPKTIEYHLRNVYDKLEIRSREELASMLRAPG